MTTNPVKCPKCGHHNSENDNFCLNCGGSIINLTPPTYAPVAAQSQQSDFQSYRFNVPSHFKTQIEENTLGPKVLFWYRIFTFLFGISFLFWVALGAMAIAGSYTLPTPKEQSDAFVGGMFFVLFGLGVFFPYLIGTFLPNKAFSWTYGIILILMSMTTCVALPFALPLFIFWIKPETKAFFGRKF
jgi:hypothetical protein